MSLGYKHLPQYKTRSLRLGGTGLQHVTTCYNMLQLFLEFPSDQVLFSVFSSGVLGDQCHFVQLSHGKWGSVGPVGPVGLEISRRAPGQDEQ